MHRSSRYLIQNFQSRARNSISHSVGWSVCLSVGPSLNAWSTQLMAIGLVHFQSRARDSIRCYVGRSVSLLVSWSVTSNFDRVFCCFEAFRDSLLPLPNRTQLIQPCIRLCLKFMWEGFFKKCAKSGIFTIFFNIAPKSNQNT